MTPDGASLVWVSREEPFASVTSDVRLDADAALDFPSLRPLAERMLRAFLSTDDPVAATSAEVRLARRDAERGHRVHLDLLVRRTCPTCGGRGEVWTEPCWLCEGTGDGVAPHQVQIVVPPGVRDGARFVFSVVPPQGPATCVRLRVSVAG